MKLGVNLIMPPQAKDLNDDRRMPVIFLFQSYSNEIARHHKKVRFEKIIPRQLISRELPRELIDRKEKNLCERVNKEGECWLDGVTISDKRRKE